MALTTDELLLPYPEGTDDANVPLRMLNLVNRLEAILTAGDVATWMPGDFKVSSRTASHGRWLLCDGRELTKAEIVTELGLDSGDADAFETLWGTGGASIYGTASTGKIRLPDARGRAVAIAGSGAGLTTRARGSAFGAETVTLSAAESGVRDHSHEAGSLAVASHTHGAGSLVIPDHSHQFNVNTGASNSNESYTGATPAGGAVYATESHIHNVAGTTAGGQANGYYDWQAVTGTSGSTAPDVAGDVNAVTHSQHASNGQSAQAAHNNIQPSLALGSLFVRV